MQSAFSVSPNANESKASSRVAAAGVRTHLSVPTRPSQLGHRHGVRAPSHASSIAEKTSPFHNDIVSGESASRAMYLFRLCAWCLPVEVQPSGMRQRPSALLRWFFLVYSVISVLFFSVVMSERLVEGASGTAAAIIGPSQDQARESTPLEGLPMSHLQSKITSIYPQPRALDAYVLKAETDSTTVSACVWATDQDLHFIAPWASRWAGPMSLLLTTTAEPASVAHAALLRRLGALQKHSALLNATLSVHVLHLARTHSAGSPPSPNALLNLARLFAQTTRVALFPANLSTAPPKTLYRTLLAASGASSPSLAITEPKPRTTRPAILTTRGQTGFPFAPLAPVVLARDDPLWCTERFFLYPDAGSGSGARMADWEECLWQIWLEHFGDVEVRQTRGWVHDVVMASPPSSTEASPTALTKIRRRLAAKFRSETCVLATRQLAALRSADKALDAKKARWLKRVCRVWMSNAG